MTSKGCHSIAHRLRIHGDNRFQSTLLGGRGPRNIVIIGVVTLVAVGVVTGIGTASMTATDAPAPSNGIESNGDGSVFGEASASDDDSEPDDNENFSVPDPAHGVNISTFPKLWSGDIDEPAKDDEGTVLEAFLSLTDYAFTHPPEAVETWNAGDHREFPRTDEHASIYPPSHADLTDELWIKDAYIQVFAVQPSTVTYVSPSDERLYIRSSGEVLGTTDYRIGLPADEHREFDPPAPEPGETVLVEETVTWRLLEHEQSNVTLEADGDPISTTEPTTTPRLEFTSLSQSVDRLSLTVTISVNVEKTTRKTYRTATEHCETQTIEEGNETRTVTECEVIYDTHSTTDVEHPSHEVTVRDTVEVEIYDLSPTATRATFTDDGSALAVNQSTGDPWASYHLPGSGEVHNIWHFYSARDRPWSTLVESTEEGTTRQPSDAIPLQVHAFPSAGGAYTESGFGALEVTEVWGTERDAPMLPEYITIPVVEEPYSDGSVVVVRSNDEIAVDDQVTVHGLVRGEEATTTVETTHRQRATTLDLEFLSLNRSEGTVTVRVTLRESGTGQPIDLRERPGVVEVHGVEVETNASGTAIVTAPIVGNFVTGEYHPGPWWTTDPVYEESRSSVDHPAEWPDPTRLVTAGFTLLIWLSPFILGIYFIDRLLGRGRIWPPWRGLE